MASTDSPAAARRRVRLAVRAAREAKRLTQGEVAERLKWSISKVNRIEKGEVTISATDLRALMALLDITDRATVDLLLQEARTARKRGWWDDPRYRPHLTPATHQLIQYEADATAIRTFQPTVIPGVMQTPAYASTVLAFWQTELTPEQRQARFEVRALRSRQLFGRADSPLYLALLDESVVMREVGGPTVLAEQLQAVLAMLASTSVVLRIVPLAKGAPLAALGGFTVLDLPTGENALMYREATATDEIVENPDLVARYRANYEHAWGLALTPEESIEKLQTHATTLTLSDRARRSS